MDPMILITPQQLQLIVEKAVRAVLDERKQAEQASVAGPISIEQAGAYLNLSVSTLYRYTSQRLIPHHKPGKNLYFYKEELDGWLLENKKLTRTEIESNGLPRY